jgi:Holliday junction resolvase RusA-like endonuclease
MNAYWRSGINPGVIPKAIAAYQTGGVKAAAKVLGGGIFVRITEKGRDYQNLVRSLLASRWRHGPICYKVSVLIEVWAPSKRYAEGGQWYFDVDNRCKPVLDVLAHANVLQNDKHVRDVRIVDRGVDPPGRIRVWIRPFIGELEIKEKSSDG